MNGISDQLVHHFDYCSIEYIWRIFDFARKADLCLYGLLMMFLVTALEGIVSSYWLQEHSCERWVE